MASVLISQTAHVTVSCYVSPELFRFHDFFFQFGSFLMSKFMSWH